MGWILQIMLKTFILGWIYLFSITPGFLTILSLYNNIVEMLAAKQLKYIV